MGNIDDENREYRIVMNSEVARTMHAILVNLKDIDGSQYNEIARVAKQIKRQAKLFNES